MAQPMSMATINAYVDLMKRHEGKWRVYYIENGYLRWETHNGIVMSAKNPAEAEEKLNAL